MKNFFTILAMFFLAFGITFADEPVVETPEVDTGAVELILPELHVSLEGSITKDGADYEADFNLTTTANDYAGEVVRVILVLSENMIIIDDDGTEYTGGEFWPYPLADYDLHFVAKFNGFATYSYSFSIINEEGEELATYSNTFTLIAKKHYSGSIGRDNYTDYCPDGDFSGDKQDGKCEDPNWVAPEYEEADPIIAINAKLYLGEETAAIVSNLVESFKKTTSLNTITKVRTLINTFRESADEYARAIGDYFRYLAFA